MPNEQSEAPEIYSGAPIIQEYINPDPEKLRKEVAEVLGDLLTFNEANLFIDDEVDRLESERDERISFIFETATRVLAKKQAQIREIDSRIAELNASIIALETERGLLFGDPTELPEYLDPKAKQQKSYDELVRSDKTMEKVSEDLLAEQPFELTGEYDSLGYIKLDDWLNINRSIIRENYGKSGLSLFTRAVRTLSFTNLVRLVEVGAVSVDKVNDSTRIAIADPKEFFGKMLDQSVKSFGPRCGLVLLKIAEMQATELDEKLT